MKKINDINITVDERVSRIYTDLRLGIPAVIQSDETYLIAPVETLNQKRFDFLRSCLKEVTLVISSQRANTLKMSSYDKSLARIKVPADRNLEWLKAVADPSKDLTFGIKGPFIQMRGGDTIVENLGLLLSKSVELLPAILCASLRTSKIKIDNLNLIKIEDLISFFEKEPITREVISARLPTETAKSGKLHVFRPDLAGPEHYAMEYGEIDRNNPVLVRIHSACFTGDILGSLKCDCGAQLGEAMNQINQNGSGILLYLNQEGRGIGLANKMRAYALQDEGFDTVEANHRLGFEDDERNFQIGASIMKELKITSIRLMTNNPRKIQLLEENGVRVMERLALKVDENEFNAHYLGIKATKSGHLL